MSGDKLEVYKIRCIEILIYLIYPPAIVNAFVICQQKFNNQNPHGSVRIRMDLSSNPHGKIRTEMFCPINIC